MSKVTRRSGVDAWIHNGPDVGDSPPPHDTRAPRVPTAESHRMILLEIAAVAALAPLLALLFEWWDRRTIAKRNALIARLSARHARCSERTAAQDPTDES